MSNGSTKGRGNPALLQADDLVPKFRSNAEMVLDKNIVDQVVETVACLETLEDISELVTLVSNGQRANGKNTATAFR